MIRIIAVLAVLTIVAGCSGTDEEKTGVQFSVALSSSAMAGIAAFNFCVESQCLCVPVASQNLPNDAGVSSATTGHGMAEHFVNLLAGTYAVTATPQADTGCTQAVTNCTTPPQQNITITAGQVASAMFETDCSSPDTAAGLDITAVINNKPLMNSDLSYNSYVCTTAPSGGGSIEDLTTYTKKDDNSHLTVTATEILAAGVTGNEDVWVYKDFGADHFDGLNINFEVQANPNIHVMGSAFIGLENQIGGMSGRSSTDLSVVMSSDGDSVSWAGIRLVRGNGVAEQYWTGSISVPYYLTLQRTAGSDTAILKIYSDSGRTALLSTLSVFGFGTTKWQYLYGFQNPNDGDGSRRWYGYSKNIELLMPPAAPLTIIFSATDADADTLTWTVSSAPSLPSGCTISDGTLTCVAGSLAAGNYQVTVRACDPRNLCTQLIFPIHAMNCSS